MLNPVRLKACNVMMYISYKMFMLNFVINLISRLHILSVYLWYEILRLLHSCQSAIKPNYTLVSVLCISKQLVGSWLDKISTHVMWMDLSSNSRVLDRRNHLCMCIQPANFTKVFIYFHYIVYLTHKYHHLSETPHFIYM